MSTEAGGGLITSRCQLISLYMVIDCCFCYYRDFVTVRYWECKGGIYYSVGKAVTHDSLPSQSGKIRFATILTDTLNRCIYTEEKMVQVAIK